MLLYSFSRFSGYVRILFGIIPIFIHKYNYLLVVSLYCISQLLDAFDGYFARLYKQETKFGALLDMITDRCSTIIMIVINITLYHNDSLFFKCSLIFLLIDISGHWIYLISSIISGNNSHKNTNTNMWVPMKIYYSNKYLLFTLHACNELMWIINYIEYFAQYDKNSQSLNIFDLLVFSNKFFITPLALLKNIMNFVHLIYGFKVVLELDIYERETKQG